MSFEEFNTNALIFFFKYFVIWWIVWSLQKFRQDWIKQKKLHSPAQTYYEQCILPHTKHNSIVCVLSQSHDMHATTTRTISAIHWNYSNKSYAISNNKHWNKAHILIHTITFHSLLRSHTQGFISIFFCFQLHTRKWKTWRFILLL